MAVLSFDDTTFGNQEFELVLTRLYPELQERKNFQKRFESFVANDEFTRSLFQASGDIIRYRTEVFFSNRVDDRPPLLLLLGNAASHSVVSGMAFAYEKSGSEHRFWKALREAGILTIPGPFTVEHRRKALMELQYRSPFRISIAVFYSMPSPANAPDWSGVSGIRKLLGAKAFNVITYDEEARFQNLVARFLSPAGAVIAFQKDAYNRIRSQETLDYTRDRANQGLLRGNYKFDENIRLAGAPPTRLMHSARSKQVLANYKDWLSGFLRL